MRVLILGASGMLGNAMLRVLSEKPEYYVYGTVRSTGAMALLPAHLHAKILTGIDVENQDQLTALLGKVRPEIVINCIGLIKQLAAADDPLSAIPINSLLPHRLARLALLADARVIHFSTDCIFSGSKGNYTEDDVSDAYDLYGRSKYLGELHGPSNFTVRTSILGHELNGTNSLIGWFLAQSGKVNGYTRAIFSGLPTVELARVVRDYIMPSKNLSGVWHISADPISKFDLLKLVADAYNKDIEIVADDQLVMDRSLNSSRFRLETGYSPPAWPELIRSMRDYG